MCFRFRGHVTSTDAESLSIFSNQRYQSRFCIQLHTFDSYTYTLVSKPGVPKFRTIHIPAVYQRFPGATHPTSDSAVGFTKVRPNDRGRGAFKACFHTRYTTRHHRKVYLIRREGNLDPAFANNGDDVASWCARHSRATHCLPLSGHLKTCTTLLLSRGLSVGEQRNLLSVRA